MKRNKFSWFLCVIICLLQSCAGNQNLYSIKTDDSSPSIIEGKEFCVGGSSARLSSIVEINGQNVPSRKICLFERKPIFLRPGMNDVVVETASWLRVSFRLKISFVAKSNHSYVIRESKTSKQYFGEDLYEIWVEDIATKEKVSKVLIRL